MKDAAFTPSVPIPSLQKSAFGMALSMGVFSNARYQLVGGIDRYLFDHAEHLVPYLGASMAFRGVSTGFGTETWLHVQVWLGLAPASRHFTHSSDACSMIHARSCLRTSWELSVVEEMSRSLSSLHTPHQRVQCAGSACQGPQPCVQAAAGSGRDSEAAAAGRAGEQRGSRFSAQEGQEEGSHSQQGL